MAFHFTKASGQYIDPGAFPAQTTKFTLAAWIMTDSTPSEGTFHTLWSRGRDALPNDQRNFDLDYRKLSGVITLTFSFTHADTTYDVWEKTVTLTNSTYYSFVMTVDWTTNPDSIQFYLNGVAQNPTNTFGSNNQTPQTTGQTTYLGAYNGAGNVATDFWDGRIAEFGAWSVVLSADDAVSLADGYSPMLVQPQNLFYYAPLVRDLKEIKSDGFTMTNHSATVIEHPRIIYPHR